jgi:hypothetical protein
VHDRYASEDKMRQNILWRYVTVCEPSSGPFLVLSRCNSYLHDFISFACLKL